MNESRPVRCRAPVRIDLAGGWTDVAEFCEQTPGHVLNLTIDRYVTAELLPRPADVEIESADYGIRLAPRSPAELPLDGPLGLIAAAVRRLPPPAGLLLRTSSDVPPQSGLGTSAATGVAVLAGLAALRREALQSVDLAELASSLERDDLGIRGGKQDQYASAQGGIRFMTFRGDVVESTELDLTAAVQRALWSDLVLVHSGSDHDSGEIHGDVSAGWRANDPDVHAAIERLKVVARRARESLLTGDLSGLAGCIDENWIQQKRLHPRISSDRIEELQSVARRNGARSGKACGAGGGGCALFLCKPGRAPRVRAALEQAGAEPLDWRVEPHGAVVIDGR